MPATFAVAALALPMAAHASLMSPELEASVATYIAWFVIIVMPIAAIVLFWLVHILPEKVAEKRHHPQKDAIQVLCLLSLLFGGLLWPIAWLWAYTKPSMHRMAYGTDKHDDYFVKMAERAEAGELGAHELQHLRDELDAIAAKSRLPRKLKTLRKDLDGAAQAAAPVPTPTPAPTPAAQAGEA